MHVFKTVKRRQATYRNLISLAVVPTFISGATREILLFSRLAKFRHFLIASTMGAWDMFECAARGTLSR
jgi:hypothetical protein